MFEDWLSGLERQFGGEIAVEEGGERWVRYRELRPALEKVEKWKGEIVPLTPENRIEDAIRMLAILSGGGIFASSNGRWPVATRRSLQQLPDTSKILQDAGTIFFTSGSSGVPKAVCHSFSSHLVSARGAGTRIPLQPGDRWWIDLPLYHVSGWGALIRSLDAGATAVFPGKEHSHAGTCSHRSVVSTQLLRILSAGWKPKSTRVVLGGGGPFPASLVHQAVRAGVPLHLTYGMTETASQVATSSQITELLPDYSCGKILPGREVRISRDGEIQVRGGVLCSAISEAGQPWRPATDPDGWFGTGDTGFLLPGGELVITGRRDRMFVSGGENIQPERIEKALLNLPGIEKAVVVPQPDREFGFRPAAILQGNGKLEEWERALRRELAGYEIPARWIAWPAFPETGGEKISHQKLQAWLAESRSRPYPVQELS